MSDPVKDVYDFADKYGSINDSDFFHFMATKDLNKLLNNEPDDYVLFKKIQTLMQVIKAPIDPDRVENLDNLTKRITPFTTNHVAVREDPYLLPGHPLSEKWISNRDSVKKEEKEKEDWRAQRAKKINKKIDQLVDQLIKLKI